LRGVEPLADPDCYQLHEGLGSYTVGHDTITFGPGTGCVEPVHMDPGERYTFLRGNLTPDGLRVYLTGRSPIRYRLVMRLSQ
jgi:hypothetical protein